MRSEGLKEGGPDRLAGAGPRKEASTFPQREPPPAEADGRAGAGPRKEASTFPQREPPPAEADGRAGAGRSLYRLDGLLAVLLLGFDDQREFRAGELDLALEALLLLLLLLPRPLR